MQEAKIIAKQFRDEQTNEWAYSLEWVGDEKGFVYISLDILGAQSSAIFNTFGLIREVFLKYHLEQIGIDLEKNCAIYKRK